MDDPENENLPLEPVEADPAYVAPEPAAEGPEAEQRPEPETDAVSIPADYPPAYAPEPVFPTPAAVDDDPDLMPLPAPDAPAQLHGEDALVSRTVPDDSNAPDGPVVEPDYEDPAVASAVLSASIKDGSFHTRTIAMANVERLPLESHALLVRLTGVPTDADVQSLAELLADWQRGP